MLHDRREGSLIPSLHAAAKQEPAPPAPLFKPAFGGSPINRSARISRYLLPAACRLPHLLTWHGLLPPHTSLPVAPLQLVAETTWQRDIPHCRCTTEQRRDLTRGKTCDAAADFSYQETALRMSGGIVDKVFDIRADGLHSALHGRDGITTACRADPDAPSGSKRPVGKSCGATAMQALKIAAEDEYFVGGQRLNPVGSCSIVIHCIRKIRKIGIRSVLRRRIRTE